MELRGFSGGPGAPPLLHPILGLPLLSHLAASGQGFRAPWLRSLLTGRDGGSALVTVTGLLTWRAGHSSSQGGPGPAVPGEGLCLFL